jgi:hypothetical protein
MVSDNYRRPQRSVFCWPPRESSRPSDGRKVVCSERNAGTIGILTFINARAVKVGTISAEIRRFVSKNGVKNKRHRSRILVHYIPLKFCKMCCVAYHCDVTNKDATSTKTATAFVVFISIMYHIKFLSYMLYDFPLTFNEKILM